MTKLCALRIDGHHWRNHEIPKTEFPLFLKIPVKNAMFAFTLSHIDDGEVGWYDFVKVEEER